MLKNISLKFTERADPVVVETEGVTIFVGPNNSGKSLVLREVELILSKNAKVEGEILQDFELEWPSESQLRDDVNNLQSMKKADLVADHIFVGRFSPKGTFEGHQLHTESLFEVFKARNKYWMASNFFKFFLIRLDGRSRFDLTNDKPMGDLIAPPKNTLSHLFQDDDLRAQIAKSVDDALSTHFVIDPTNGGELRIRLSPTKPHHDEQSLNKQARDFHRQATYIKDASDGVQAFVGLLTAVRAGDYRAILIDEPEAFLHPPLARKLGFELASIVTKRASGSLMASTHSPDFLIGCLQASTNVRVVRLEYSNGRSKGQIVDSKALSKFFKTPLMRSANVISALFHDGVVVTESDNDRAFYSEIYYRLAEQEKGYPSVLFVNAQNKQTIQDIIGPLRAFGVPAVAIVDIDILKDGGATWIGWLQAAQVPTALHVGLGQVRADLKKRLEATNKDMKADGGISLLNNSDQAAANELFDTLANFGIFVTRAGELEHWLKHLNVPGKKTTWTIEMLTKLGSDPTDLSYVRPVEGDVWAFMRNIVGWIKNPARKG